MDLIVAQDKSSIFYFEIIGMAGPSLRFETGCAEPYSCNSFELAL